MNSPAIELEGVPGYRRRAVSVEPAAQSSETLLVAKPARALNPVLAKTLAAIKAAGVIALFPVLVLAAWWATAHFGVLPEKILPGPETVARTFVDLLIGGDIASNLGVSLWRVAKGVALGVSLGLLLGLALGFSPAVDSWIGPTFRTLAQIPSIALIPLLMTVLGIDDTLKLFIMVKACVIPLAFTTSDGIRNIPTKYLEVGRVFGLSRWTTLTRVILPGALPSIFSGLRQGVAHVWVSLVAVEVLASAEGIGYLMTWGRLIFQLDVVIVCVILIGVIGFALDFTLKRAESRLLRWRGSEVRP
jgi:sulfonate transport system permease protein